MFVGTQIIELTSAQAPGNRSVNATMSRMLQDLQAINPAHYYATHMRLRSLSIPYGDGNDNTMVVQPDGNISQNLYTTFSSVASINATRIRVVDSSSIWVYNAMFGTTNICTILQLPSGNIESKLTNNPASGTKAYANVEFYKLV